MRNLPAWVSAVSRVLQKRLGLCVAAAAAPGKRSQQKVTKYKFCHSLSSTEIVNCKCSSNACDLASASSLLWDWACSNSNSKCSTLCCLREAARPYRGFLGCHEGQNWPKLMLVFCNVTTPAMRQVTVQRELNFVSIRTCLSHFIGRASWQVDSTFLAESDSRAGHTSLPGFIAIVFSMAWSKISIFQ